MLVREQLRLLVCFQQKADRLWTVSFQGTLECYISPLQPPPFLFTAPLPFPASCLVGRSGCLEEGGTSLRCPICSGLHGWVGSDGPASNTLAGRDIACYKYGLHVKRSRQEGQPGPPSSLNTSDTYSILSISFQSPIPLNF